jgi:hypothetical protein
VERERALRVEHPVCPFCKDEVRAAPQQACGACRAWHHADCWTENGGRCAACGADVTGVVAPPRPVVRAPAPLTDEEVATLARAERTDRARAALVGLGAALGLGLAVQVFDAQSWFAVLAIASLGGILGFALHALVARK